MWFYVPLVALAIAFVVWFVRPPLFRAHLHGHWKDPEQAEPLWRKTSAEDHKGRHRR